MVSNNFPRYIFAPYVLLEEHTLSWENKEIWYYYSKDRKQYGIVLGGKEIVKSEIDYLIKNFPENIYEPQSKVPSWVLNSYCSPNFATLTDKDISTFLTKVVQLGSTIRYKGTP